MGGQGSEGMRQFPLQQSFECQQSSPSGKHLPSIEEWTAQGKRKSSQAEAWKRVSPAFVSTDATCSRFRSTPPTPSSSSRAASVICTATSIMQAMASRWSAAAETLEVDIVMVAKPFSLNTHLNQNACRRNTGSMERRAEASAKEIVRDCEETVRICAFFIDTWEHTPARDSYCKGLRCTATWLSANEIGRDLYPEGKGKSSSDIFWSVDERSSWEDIQLVKGLKAASTKSTAAIVSPGLPFALSFSPFHASTCFGSMLCSFWTCYCLEGAWHVTWDYECKTW